MTENIKYVDPITGVECNSLISWNEARKTGIITDEMSALMKKGLQPAGVHSFSEHTVTVSRGPIKILVKARGENHSRIEKTLKKIENENYSHKLTMEPADGFSAEMTDGEGNLPIYFSKKSKDD